MIPHNNRKQHRLLSQSWTSLRYAIFVVSLRSFYHKNCSAAFGRCWRALFFCRLRAFLKPRGFTFTASRASRALLLIVREVWWWILVDPQSIWFCLFSVAMNEASDWVQEARFRNRAVILFNVCGAMVVSERDGFRCHNHLCILRVTIDVFYGSILSRWAGPLGFKLHRHCLVAVH